MNTSSVQPTCSITSSDTITIDLSSITTSTTWAGGVGTITLSSPITTANTISITDLSSEYEINWGNVEWVDRFPDFDRIQKMCKEYPSLKIAFDKLRTTYNLVKDDFDTPADKRTKP